MGKNKPRAKGYRAEKAIVDQLKGMDIAAKRIPLSGSCSDYPGDIEIAIQGKKLIVEAKVRANGFKTLYRWLEGKDGLIVREVSPKIKTRPFLIVMELPRFFDLLTGVDGRIKD